EIAEAVRELGIGTVDDRFRAIAAVLAERDLSQEEIAERINAEALSEHHRIDDIADALRHLLTPAEKEAMPVHLLWQSNTRGHQECRPIDRVEPHDVLADQVNVSGPIAAPELRIVGITKPRDVIRQRIQPD